MFFGKFQKGFNDFSITGSFLRDYFQALAYEIMYPRSGGCTLEQSLHLHKKKRITF